MARTQDEYWMVEQLMKLAQEQLVVSEKNLQIALERSKRNVPIAPTSSQAFFESIQAMSFSSLAPVFCFVQCMSVVPLDIFRWVIAGVAGFMSATFVALNLRAHIMSAGERWFFIVAGIFVLQLALAVVLKFYLFTVSV